MQQRRQPPARARIAKLETWTRLPKPTPGREPEAAENCYTPQVGTKLAKLRAGFELCACSPVTPMLHSWGGPRNRADLGSTHLSYRQAKSILNCQTFSQKMGFAFNRHWTIHYERAGIAERDAVRFIGRLLNRVGKQARRDGGELAAIWVRENTGDTGGHVHILLYLPPGTTLRNRTRRWIIAAGGTMSIGVSNVKSIGGSLRAALEGGEHYLANLAALLAYLLKGADAKTGEALGLPRSGHVGPIIGKRAGWTQNIGDAAQRRWEATGTHPADKARVVASCSREALGGRNDGIDAGWSHDPRRI